MHQVADEEFEQLLQLFEALGFRTDLVARQPNFHPRGTPDATEEQQLRNILSDYAEFIVPVFWSRTEFVGSVNPGSSSSLDLIKSGHSEIVKAGLAEGQAAPRPSWANMPNFIPYEEWAYARNSVSGYSTQPNSPMLRRQGFLIVGRKKISIVGLYSDFQPSLEQVDRWGVSPSLLRDPHWQYTNLARVLPPENGNIAVEKELGFHEVESVQPVELVRFDGLAAFLKVVTDFQIDGASKQFRKWQEQTIEWLWTLPAPIRSIAKLQRYLYSGTDWGMGSEGSSQIPQLLLSNFQLACDDITHGAIVVSGTGVNDEGYHNQYLFTSALGLAIESAIDGTKIFVESPFSEIDAAWDLISHQIQTVSHVPATAVAPTPSASGTVDLASELSKLATLHQSGVLSDDEFAAAKAAVISNLSR